MLSRYWYKWFRIRGFLTQAPVTWINFKEVRHADLNLPESNDSQYMPLILPDKSHVLRTISQKKMVFDFTNFHIY